MIDSKCALVVSILRINSVSFSVNRCSSSSVRIFSCINLQSSKSFIYISNFLAEVFSFCL